MLKYPEDSADTSTIGTLESAFSIAADQVYRINEIDKHIFISLSQVSKLEMGRSKTITAFYQNQAR